MVIDKKIGNTIENLDITVRGLPDNSPHEKQKDFIYDLLKKIQSAAGVTITFQATPGFPGLRSEKFRHQTTYWGT